MLRLVGVLLLLWFDECGAAVQLPQTESGGWITIIEETQYSIMCNGFDEGSNVTWSLIHPDNTTTNIGSCGPSQTSCPSSDSNLQLSRNRKQESFMKIKSGHRALIGTSGTEITAKTDFHPDSAESGDQLISGNCNITRDLPTSDGVYTYDLKFYPGPDAPQTVANVTIRSPQAPHTAPNCPEYVAEKDTVTCDCVTTDPGSPPSEIRWLEFTSHQLIVHNVTPDMNGTVYTCLQTWKSRAFANVTYTLHVTGAPRAKQSTTLKITTKENESSSTSLKVVAYPQPNLTTVIFLGASPSSSNISSVEQMRGVLAAECGPTQELYVFNCTLTAIRPATSDQGFYNVTLENPYGEITQMVKLTVMSMSKQGAKYQSKETDQKHISVTSDDEFEEHVNCIYESSDGVLLTAKQQPGPSKPSATALALPPFTKLTDNDDEQETSFGYVTLKGEKPTENSAALGNRDRGALTSQCTDVADEYSTVDDDGRTFAVSSGRKFVPQSTAGRSSDYADVDVNSSVDDGSGKFLAGQPDPQTDMASDYADAGGYSSVKASGPSTSAQKTSRIRDDYAVVNKARKAKPDEYAQVNKASKGGKPPFAPKDQNGAKPTSDVYAQVQKSKPATKAKPGRETDGRGQGPADDEYNVLNFGDHQPTSQDIDEQYSHIKMSS
ncbi:hypothetical protein BaRGS_00036295 [Batillaria attramentaria]|uniref:Ig-like domain-containing protein n=1 Tax=Batillaria attramentaria TaxID=370345 RepID=A0ABD0JCD8_9CAEN